VVKEPPSLQEQVEDLIRRKKTYGQYNHGSRQLCGVPINEWFNDPTGFLRALITAGFIVPGKPESSPFLNLLGFRGPMYRVFTDAEIELWRRWILEEAWSLAEPEPDGPELTSDVKRLKAKLAKDPGLTRLLSGDRLDRLHRVTSARRISLWLDLVDRHASADPASGANGVANGKYLTAGHAAERKMSAIDARFRAWTGWGMVRALNHVAAQSPIHVPCNGLGSNGADITDGRTITDWLADIRDAAHPVRAARACMAALSAEFERQEDASAAAFMQRLSTTMLAPALGLVVPGNDGRCLRDTMTAWLESGCPLPDVPHGELRPLRLDSTLDEEEHHPTGVAMGFGTVH
jgi:hypothetical protein